jgi:hypothetical protein
MEADRFSSEDLDRGDGLKLVDVAADDEYSSIRESC